MVPVRKPGRPLSTCPCPPGRPCACGGVRVAIPKKQKCKCPTETADEDDGSEQEQSPAETPAETPTSPSRPSFRVAKPNPGSKGNSRKQSFDPANLERMDPRSINLIVAPNGNGTSNGISMTGSTDLQGSQAELPGFGPGIGLVSASPSSTYASPSPSYGASTPYSMGLQYTQPNHLQHAMKVDGSGLVLRPNGNFGPMPPPPFVNGNHNTPPISSPPQPTVLGPSPVLKTTSIPSGSGSCCGSKSKGPSPRPSNVQIPQQGYEQSYIPQFQYPTVFTYPADIGSWQHPIDPTIWQQMVQTSMPLSTPIPPAANGDAGDVGTSHQCSCGEGCQCVGCLAHPFNAQMFQYVNNAYGGSNGSSPGAGGANGQGAADAGAPGGCCSRVAAGPGHESPPEAPTPAASEGSPAREEQSLSTLDYFFVNLPISGLCGGHLESCPCGDSCDCPGCLVHGVPV
jgi:hypothetical protein